MKPGIIITAVTFTVIAFTGNGQGIVGKLKQKAAQIGERTVEKKIDEKTGISQPGSAPVGGPRSGRAKLLWATRIPAGAICPK